MALKPLRHSGGTSSTGSHPARRRGERRAVVFRGESIWHSKRGSYDPKTMVEVEWQTRERRKMTDMEDSAEQSTDVLKKKKERPTDKWLLQTPGLDNRAFF